MNPDDIDRIADELFDAARDERPTKSARERARVAAVDSLPSRWVGFRNGMLLALAAVVATVALAMALPRQEEAVELVPDPALVPTPKQVVPAPPSAKPARDASPTPSASQSARVKPERRLAPLTLDAELRMLQEVRAAITSGDSVAALRGLDQYERRGRQLRAEATLLRVEALALAGRNAEAKALAKEFVSAHPTNPLVDTAETYLEESSELSE